MSRTDIFRVAFDLERQLAEAKACAHDGGGICPFCGDGYSKRIADHNGEPNALWECTKCHEAYYTHTDSITASYYHMKKKISEELGFDDGPFLKQLYAWIEKHKKES